MTQPPPFFPKATVHQSFEAAAIAANAAEDKKALDVHVMEVGNISSLSDYFVVCTGESPAQLRAIADHVDKTLRGCGQELLGQEKDRAGRWLLLDYGDIVVHIMHPSAREFYDLENFWNHACQIDRQYWAAQQRQAS